MKVVFLFMVTIMLFFLYLVPMIWTFTTAWNHDIVGVAYGFWYVMLFILTICWAIVVEKRGCWFFSK